MFQSHEKQKERIFLLSYLMGHCTLELEGLKDQGTRGLRKFEWIENLHGILHGRKWIMLNGLLDLASGRRP